MPNDKPRRPYAAPGLIIYGDLTAITLLNPTANNKNDPGNSSTTKT